jgi:hypothetical protein
MPGVAASDLFDKFQRKPEDCPEDRWEICIAYFGFPAHTGRGSWAGVLKYRRVFARPLKRYLATFRNGGTRRPRRRRTLPFSSEFCRSFAAVEMKFLARMRRLRTPWRRHPDRSASHVEEALRRAEQQFGELDLFSDLVRTIELSEPKADDPSGRRCSCVRRAALVNAPATGRRAGQPWVTGAPVDM